MKNIAEVLEGVKTVGIGGHIRPDGDCVGSCMALYLYIRKYFPDIDVNVYHYIVSRDIREQKWKKKESSIFLLPVM